MTSNAPARCCTIGVKHQGHPKGEIKDVQEVPTYIAYPEDKQTATAILILSDVIGHTNVNAQLIADQFAANGYFVVMPDLFEGDPILLNNPPDDVPKWLQTSGPQGKGHGPDQVDPIVEKVINEMKSNMGVTKIGAVGYCFGARFVARFAAQDKGIEVACMAHPSFVGADELKAMITPLSIAAAETDQIFPVDKRHETEDILREQDIPYQICLYSDCQHGFAVRGDPANPRVKFAKEAAFLQHVQWFNEFFKDKGKVAV